MQVFEEARHLRGRPMLLSSALPTFAPPSEAKQPAVPKFPDVFTASRFIVEQGGAVRQPGWERHDYNVGLHSTARVAPYAGRMDETLIVGKSPDDATAYTVWRDATNYSEKSCELFSQGGAIQPQALLDASSAVYRGATQVPMGATPGSNVTADWWHGQYNSPMGPHEADLYVSPTDNTQVYKIVHTGVDLALEFPLADWDATQSKVVVPDDCPKPSFPQP